MGCCLEWERTYHIVSSSCCTNESMLSPSVTFTSPFGRRRDDVPLPSLADCVNDECSYPCFPCTKMFAVFHSYPIAIPHQAARDASLTSPSVVCQPFIPVTTGLTGRLNLGFDACNQSNCVFQFFFFALQLWNFQSSGATNQQVFIPPEPTSRRAGFSIKCAACCTSPMK